MVLVVGSAQAGCQITEELLAGGRDVVLATSAVGRVPTPYRGRDTVEWLYEPGFFHQRPADLPDPAMMQARQPILAPGRGLSLQALAHAGATLTGRLVAVDDQRVIFDDSARANVAAGDAFAARVAAMIDDVIEARDGKRHLPSPLRSTILVSKSTRRLSGLSGSAGGAGRPARSIASSTIAATRAAKASPAATLARRCRRTAPAGRPRRPTARSESAPARASACRLRPRPGARIGWRARIIAGSGRSAGRWWKNPASYSHSTVSRPRYGVGTRPTGLVASTTCLPAASSSSVIWQPAWALPTTSTTPSGSAAGLR